MVDVLVDVILCVDLTFEIILTRTLRALLYESECQLSL